jgi:dihydropteroate synthase
MQVLDITNQKELEGLMRDIRVDGYGIRIMAPKAMTHVLRINSLSNIMANILKQEMLALGADAAVSRDALTGRSKNTPCLLIGNLAQFSRLSDKLKIQPFGLNRLAGEITQALDNYQNNDFVLSLGRHKLDLKSRARIMGIMNLTPDSFSGDGLLRVSSVKCQVSSIVDFAEKMVRDGADIIDIGGESSRPGAKPVPVKEELKRVIPAIKALSKKIKVPLSIDTYKTQVARVALDNGATLVNDITGLRDAKMARLIARYKAAVVIMHMRGVPRTMQNNPRYVSLIEEMTGFFQARLQRAEDAGIAAEKIILDPGIGFGKSVQDNLEILKHLSAFRVLGKPILVGPSRKSFIGKILNAEPAERLFGTISACILALNNGARILRVHDVRALREALKVYEAIER